MCTGGGRMHLAPIWLSGTMCLRKATIFNEYKKFKKKLKGNSMVWYIIVTRANEI